MTDQSLPSVPRPDHVPSGRVVDFDLYSVPGAAEDIQLAMRAIQQTSPDVFWTPRNGGHWVFTRAADIDTAQRDWQTFSNNSYLVPKKPADIPRELPLEVDPPRHTALRRPLTMALLPRTVLAIEDRIAALAAQIIGDIAAKGQCEFVDEVAQVVPICIYLDLVDLPREDRHFLLPITKAVVHGRTPEARRAAQDDLVGYMLDIVRARREKPGDDLLSRLVTVEEDGRRISEADALSYASLVLFGGLDTVAAMLSLVVRFLARNPDHRREMIANLDDDAFMRTALEELLRRHGIATTARELTHDHVHDGVLMKQGEMVLVINMLAGFDERHVEDPLTVDLRRHTGNTHAMFGAGPHTCPGAALARRELRIVLREWLRRIPDFAVVGSTSITGPVSGLTELRLSWPPQVHEAEQSL